MINLRRSAIVIFVLVPYCTSLAQTETYDRETFKPYVIVDLAVVRVPQSKIRQLGLLPPSSGPALHGCAAATKADVCTDSELDWASDPYGTTILPLVAEALLTDKDAHVAEITRFVPQMEWRPG
jgi:hypothetical protein